jgi:glycosyl transferase family 92
MAYLSVCAIYRDEGPYLREWIEFHRLFGVERFYLYNNLSEDDHQEELAPYVADGTVVPFEWPMFPGQLQAYDHCLQEQRDESRWIAFIDLDEFLFSPTGQAVSEILPEFEEFPGVGVNCIAYGTSGHKTKPPGLVIENYVRRGVIERRNRIIKSIVDPTRAERSGNEPHYFRYRDFARAVNENKEPIKGSRTETLSCDRLRINHYITRSQEERDRKMAGPVAFTGKPKPAEGARERDRPLNEQFDDVIVRFAPAVRDALAARGAAAAR